MSVGELGKEILENNGIDWSLITPHHHTEAKATSTLS